ncbi:zinc finger CCCH domain-containing protein 20-like [Impatiens glandulifera]|uniref:zinc finger CCCH domain-containing protein 20-like n=1 Tax=Impatiens glandulifera TaxID=253017 RepID=UPI001FB122DA|nr:zinc finger CCCH domain-containing protein 20-like [Impatiens glandulifera]
MMIGERNHPNQKIHFYDDPFSDHLSTGDNAAPDLFSDSLPAALQRYLPSNNVEIEFDESNRESDLPLEAYSSDHFRMFEFKVVKCTHGRSHDWTECPYAHPGEKARRRDPRKYHYSGTACPDFRKGNCKKSDLCEYAHGVFECWLHPARYRTQPCKDGFNCRRRVCFFAHSPEQLRVISPRSSVTLDCSSAQRHVFMSSPESASPTSDSPPMSPMNLLSRSVGSSSINEVVASLRQLQLNKMKTMPPAWIGYQTPRALIQQNGFNSLPTTPTQSRMIWEEPAMERVESGRDLRVKMFEKLSRENPLNPSFAADPDIGWVSDLLK